MKDNLRTPARSRSLFWILLSASIVVATGLSLLPSPAVGAQTPPATCGVLDWFEPVGANITLSYPSPTAVDSDGNVYVVDQKDSQEATIDVFSPTGTYLRTIPSFATGRYLLHLAIDTATDEIYAATESTVRIYRLANDGTVMGSFVPSGNLTNMDFADGKIYLAYNDTNIRVYSPAGTLLQTITAPYSNNVDLDVVPELGRIYATTNSSATTNNVWVSNLSGTLITTYAATGSGAGQVTWPTSINVDPLSRVFYVFGEVENKVVAYDERGFSMDEWAIDIGYSFETAIDAAGSFVIAGEDGLEKYGTCAPSPINLYPTATLVGDATEMVMIDSTYVDGGATATDPEDGDITGSLVTTGSVDTSTVGFYTLTYTFTDSGGLTDSVSRLVHVVDYSLTCGELLDQFDLTDGSAFPRSLVEGPDGSVYMTTWKDNVGDNDGAIVKYDASGNEIWSVTPVLPDDITADATYTFTYTDANLPADGDTVAILMPAVSGPPEGKVWTFVTDVDDYWEVKIVPGDADATILNFVRANNLSGGTNDVGGDYLAYPVDYYVSVDATQDTTGTGTGTFTFTSTNYGARGNDVTVSGTWAGAPFFADHMLEGGSGTANYEFSTSGGLGIQLVGDEVWVLAEMGDVHRYSGVDGMLLQIYDANTGAVINENPFPYPDAHGQVNGGAIFGLDKDPNTGYLWLWPATGSAWGVNPITRTIVQESTIDVPGFGYYVGISPDGHFWHTQNSNSNVYELDNAYNLLNTYTITGGHRGRQVKQSQVTDAIYIQNNASEIVKYDTSDFSPTASFSASGLMYVSEDYVYGSNGSTTIYKYGSCEPVPAATPTPTPSRNQTGSFISAEQLARLFGSPTPTPSPAPSGGSAGHGLNEGDPISASPEGDPDVYIVNSHGFKRLFLNPVIFGFYGHLGGWSAVKGITKAIRDEFITSGLFRNCEANDEKVYAVEVTGEDTGTLHHVQMTGEQAVAQSLDFFNRVFCINNKEFSWYSKSPIPYTSLDQLPVYKRE